MLSPLVTVVIPTYNRLALLQQAITSVLVQSYTHWELIVVDDGSTDGTADAVSSIKDQRIQVLKMQHTGNIARLRNAGVGAGTGEWLAFLDSDDVWIPQRLELQLPALLNEKRRWGYGQSELMDEGLNPIPRKSGNFRPISGWIAKEVLTTEASVALGALLVERTLFDEAGGFNPDPNLLLREDYELVIRLSLKAEALAIPPVLVRMREHEDRSTNQFEYGHERMAFVYEHFLGSHPERELAKIARLRFAHEIAESASKKIHEGKYLHATMRIGKAFINGDHWRHLLSVIRRGFSN
jgi:glycosyltransferase involved in cell wall biosynthesis